MTGPAPEPAAGGLPAGVTLVLAPNPGPMTLEGTNTWVLHAPGAPGAVVVDPGPDDEGHRRAVLAAVAAAGARVALVLLTHSHLDHSAGAAALGRAAQAPVRARGAAAHPLVGGEVLTGGSLGDLDLHVVATPGHTADSTCFLLRPAGPQPALLSGDTVLGRGSSAVAAPDGVLGDHLDSLLRLRALLDRPAVPGGAGAVLLPGHGPAGAGAAAALAAAWEHRRQRLAQVREAVAAGARTPAEVVDAVYPQLAGELRRAAELTVAATLQHLGDEHRS